MQSAQNKYRRSRSVQIWFLDADPVKSAEYQTNHTLVKSIDGCYNALCAARFYFSGIRNRKFYEHFFGKGWKDGEGGRICPDWPLKARPPFKFYTAKFSKWCRKCREHYEYTLGFMEALLAEYEFRFRRQHGLARYAEWERRNSLNVPAGNLKKIDFPWKSLSLKYRRKDIVQGFRLQFMSQLEGDDPYLAYRGSCRDIPDFVQRHFGFQVQNFD